MPNYPRSSSFWACWVTQIKCGGIIISHIILNTMRLKKPEKPKICLRRLSLRRFVLAAEFKFALKIASLMLQTDISFQDQICTGIVGLHSSSNYKGIPYKLIKFYELTSHWRSCAQKYKVCMDEWFWPRLRKINHFGNRHRPPLSKTGSKKISRARLI